eukprot:scaffold24164_cov101-Isochrysis_galbana.AAC.1
MSPFCAFTCANYCKARWTAHGKIAGHPLELLVPPRPSIWRIDCAATAARRHVIHQPLAGGTVAQSVGAHSPAPNCDFFGGHRPRKIYCGQVPGAWRQRRLAHPGCAKLVFRAALDSARRQHRLRYLSGYVQWHTVEGRPL